MKSSLNRPWKFLIRFLSSVLPSEASEVVVCSKHSFEIIICALEKILCVGSGFNIVWVGETLLGELQFAQ